jgi:MFS family permease
MRLVGRHWPSQTGRRYAAFAGLVSLTASMLTYLWVGSEWGLAFPALAAGTGQALLFPAVTTLGAESFPERYRGTATTLILGIVDMGGLCGAPILGLIVDHYGFRAMFLCAACTIFSVAIAFMASCLVQRTLLERPLGEVAGEAGEQLAEW